MIYIKTLIFNGSPRKNGDSVHLINELKNHLEGDIKIVNAYYDNISPCIDCRFCWKNSGCSIKDDMSEVYEYLKDADNLIIASPIYFSTLTGELLSVFSRLETLWCASIFRKESKNLKEKRGVLILTGGANGSIDLAKSTANIIFNELNTKCIDTIVSLSTNQIPASEDKVAVEKVKKIAEKLNIK